MKLTFLWRIFFLAGILFTIGFFFTHINQLTVDTNLKDLSPTLSEKQAVRDNIDTLSNDATKRIVLLITANEEHTLNNAVESLQIEISKSDDIKLNSAVSLESHVIALLQPYRFNFLTDKQTELLSHKNINELVDIEQRKLYRLGEGFRLLPFEEDPLAWFSDYVLTTLETLQLTKPSPQEQPLHFTILPLTISNNVNSMVKQEALLAHIKNLEKNIKAEHAVNIHHSGLFFFTIDAAKKSKQDIQKIAIGSTIGVLLLMITVFRSLAPLLVSFISILLGVGFATAVTYSVFNKIHVLTIVFGASLIGIVIDYSLHYFFHQFAQQNKQTHTKAKAHNTLVRAMMLSVITSLIGFSALAFSDLQSLKKVAVFSCSGLIMAWLCVMSLGDYISSRHFTSHQGPLIAFLRFMQSLVARRPKPTLISGSLLAFSCALYIAVCGIKTNDDPRFFFNASPELVEQERYISQYNTSFEANRYFLISGESEAQVYEQLRIFHDAVSQTGDDKIFSILTLLPSAQTQEVNYTLQQKLYGENAVVPQLLTKLGVPSSSAAQATHDYITSAHQTVTPSMLLDGLPQLPPLWAVDDKSFHATIFIDKSSNIEHLKKLAQHMDSIDYIDVIGLTQEALQQQRYSASQLLIAAYILVALLMVCYYRKIHVILLLGIPISATLFTLCLLSFFGQAITIFHIMALFLVLGLGMDYVIFTHEMGQKDNVTMQAILLSAITTLLSFGLLSFSSMPIVQAFGSTLLIGNTVNLLATLILFTSKKNELTESS